MKMFLAALMAVTGSAFFFASAPDADAGNCYRTTRVSYARPVYHRPVYRAPAVVYRQVYRPAYRVNPYYRYPTRTVCYTQRQTYRPVYRSYVRRCRY